MNFSAEVVGVEGSVRFFQKRQINSKTFTNARGDWALGMCLEPFGKVLRMASMPAGLAPAEPLLKRLGLEADGIVKTGSRSGSHVEKAE